MVRAGFKMAIAAQETGRIGIFELDVASGELRVSPEFCRIFGLPIRASLALQELAAMVHPADHHLFSFARVKAGADVVPEREYHFTRSGAWPALDLPLCHAGARRRGPAGETARHGAGYHQRKRSVARIGALLELGDQLRNLSGIEDIALTAASPWGGARGEQSRFRCGGRRAGTVVVKPEWCVPGVKSIAGKHRFRNYGSFIENLKKGEMRHRSRRRDRSQNPRHHAALRRIGVRQLINVPVFDHSTLWLIVLVHHNAAFEWADEDIAFVRSFGDRIQSAIARLQAKAEQTMLNRESAIG